MYLYDRKDLGTISVYQMEPIKNLISDFRRSKLAHPNGEIYRIATNVKKTPFRFLQLECRTVSDFAHSDISYDRTNIFGINKYHELLRSTGIDEEDKAFLDDYYKGQYDRSPLIRVFDYDQDKKKLDIFGHFLIGEDYKASTILGVNNERYINKILSLPEDVYNLELLNRGFFSLINNSADISDQVQLFEFSKEPIYVANVGDLSSLENLGLVVRTNDFLKKIEDSQKVLQYARRSGAIKK